MASFNIHLAVGKRYLEKFKNVKNVDEFYDGVIAPDLVEEKAVSHYSGNQETDNLKEHLKNKVLLYKFLEANDISSDYNKGVFIHLITDYLFFNLFFDNEFIENTTSDEFSKNLYYSYDISNSHVIKKYNLNTIKILKDLQNYIKKGKKEKKIIIENHGENILPAKELDEFIEYVSNIDLEKYKDKIMKYKCNMKP